MAKKLAICNGEPIRKDPFPSWPVFGQEERKAVLEVLESGKWAHVLEPDCNVARFEIEFSKYYGTKYGVTVTSGCVALEIALRSCGIGYGDEVITTPTTWVATSLAPVMVGADPVFVDVEPETYCIDPEKIEAAITPRTKAIIPVHIGGYLCNMDRIMEIAEKHHLIVIEDCAQAHGSKYKGKLVGAIGDFGCFSFQISKIMTAGQGGMIITNNDHWGNYAYSSANAGAKYRSEKTREMYPGGRITGWNARMTEFQAAILLVQLTRLDKHKKKRIENAEYLKKRIAEIEGLTTLRQDPDQNYYSYIFKYDSSYFEDIPVQKFRKALEAEGIPRFSSVSEQFPVYRSPVFYSPRRRYLDVYCPVAEKAFTEEAVGLPATWVLIGEKKDMDDIIEAILKIKENLDELHAL